MFTQEQTEQASIVKQELFKLAQMLSWNRLEVHYVKQKKFSDDGCLDIHEITHVFSS